MSGKLARFPRVVKGPFRPGLVAMALFYPAAPLRVLQPGDGQIPHRAIHPQPLQHRHGQGEKWLAAGDPGRIRLWREVKQTHLEIYPHRADRDYRMPTGDR